MAATKTFVNYKSDLLSFNVANEQFLGVIEPGRVRGFDTLYTPAPGLIFNLLHDLTGIKKVRIDGTTESPETGVVFTRQGVVAQFEAEVENLAVNTNATGAAERIDVIYFQHSYQQTTANNLGVVGIEQGVPGAGEPNLALPTQMVKIGTITMPAGASQVQASYYTPTDNRGVGGADYALEETVIAWLTSQDARRKDDLWPFYSDLARFIPPIPFGTSGADLQPSGLVLAVPSINDSVVQAVTIGSFYTFLDGVICYYPGGTFDLETDGTNDKILWFQRGTGTIQGNASLPYDVVSNMVAYIGDLPNTGATGTFTKPATYNNNNDGVGVIAAGTLSNANLNIIDPDSHNNGFTILGAMGVDYTNSQVAINTSNIATNSSNIQQNANDIGDIQTDLVILEDNIDDNTDAVALLASNLFVDTVYRGDFLGTTGRVTQTFSSINNNNVRKVVIQASGTISFGGNNGEQRANMIFKIAGVTIASYDPQVQSGSGNATRLPFTFIGDYIFQPGETSITAEIVWSNQANATYADILALSFQQIQIPVLL